MAGGLRWTDAEQTPCRHHTRSMTAYTANARWRHATTMADAVAAALTGTQTKTASNGCGASIRLTYEAEPPRTMDIQQPATLAESRKAPIVVGSGDLLGVVT